MAVITDPKTGIIVSAPFKSDQWVDVKKCRRWLTFFMSRVVSQMGCTTLPVSPVEGQVVVMASTDGTYPNQIARYSTDLLDWEYLAPWDGLSVSAANGAPWYYCEGRWSQYLLPSGLHSDTADFSTMPSGWVSWDILPNANQSIPPAWSPGTAAISAQGGDLKIVPTSTNYKNISASLRSITPTNWRLTANISVCRRTPYTYAGICLTDANGLLSCFTINHDGKLCYYQPIAGSSTVVMTLALNSCWMRVTKSGSNLIYEYSIDGRAWFDFATRTIGAAYEVGTPTKYGICCCGNTTPGAIACSAFYVEEL